MRELSGRVIAVVGGDEREQEIVRQAVDAGATVRVHGCPWPDAGIEGATLVDDAPSALDGADYALLPIPGIADDGSLFAPAAPRPIILDADALGRMGAGAAVILGAADGRLRAAAATHGIPLIEYEADQELMLLRGPAIVEGALAQIIANTDVTIHAADIAVIGQGNIGRLLTRTLVALGARVHVLARNPVQRAEAYTAGAVAHPLEDLEEVAAGVAMLLSTVPARLVGGPVLKRLPAGALVMDLAAPPGGIDLDAAQRCGLRAVWARGLGRRAPVTVGRSQWRGILQRIREREGER